MIEDKIYEIYWDDLTPEAQERLSELYHGNLDIMPLADLSIKKQEE